MRVLFDTSVLIASLLKLHEFHSRSARWLTQAQGPSLEMFVSAHTLAELYSSLTSMPKPYKVPPDEAWSMIDTNLLQHSRIRTLRASQYAKLINGCPWMVSRAESSMMASLRKLHNSRKRTSS